MAFHWGGRGPGHMARRASGASGVNFYVDSVTGSDSDSGATEALAFQTLNKLQTSMATSKSAAIMAGSSWREALNVSSYSANIIFASGSGAIPVISGADVVATWTAEGTANVWQASVTHDATSTHRLTVYEDGNLLTRVTSVATCSSTPGSFVDIKGSDGSPVTVKIHATGSGNPNSNGKTYEVSKRMIALTVGASASVSGPLITQKAISNDGSFIAGASSSVSRVLAKHGTKHNFFLTSGVASDCIAWGSDDPTSYEITNTLFVSYADTPTGMNYSYERCGAVIPSGTGGGSQSFYHAHGSSSPLHYAIGTLRQCWSSGAGFAGHAGGADTCVEIGCFWKGRTFIKATNTVYTMDRSLAYVYKTVDGLAAQITVLAGNTLQDCGIYFEKRISSDNPGMRTDGGANAIINSTLVMGGAGAANAHAFAAATGSGSLNVQNSVIAGFSGHLLDVRSGMTYTGNNNIFWLDNQFVPTTGFFGVYLGTEYTSLATWQSLTGQESNSVYALVADQAAGDADALFLAWAEAAPATDLSTIGPAVGDFRLNPSAKVYNSAGTALTGTLADGTTPITDCGPQNYWDWNARQSVAGCPTAFPDIPISEAESETYISAPASWDFYP